MSVSNATFGDQNSSQVQLDHKYLNDITYLYHICQKRDDSLKTMFQDVKFICLGGKPTRMQNFAELLYDKLGQPENSIFDENVESADKKDRKLKDLAATANRYALYKVGPVLSASHGIGSASTSVILHELLILAYYAGCSDVTFIRIGTSGGLGLEPGTVVITKQAYNGLLEPFHKQIACGKEYKYDTDASPDVAEKIRACAESIKVNAVIGNTMGTDDFYEEQCRLDGAFCSFTEEDKIEFIQRAHDDHGIKNIEMESSCFIAMCKRAKVKCAVVCCTIIDRLQGDTILADSSVINKWEAYPQEVVAEFIKRNI